MKIGMKKKELNQEDCQACLNQFIEDTDYCIGDEIFNDHDEEIDTLQQLINEYFELINEQSKINQWIPVGERMPEKKGAYLVTYHPCHWDNVDFNTVCVERQEKIKGCRDGQDQDR